MDAVCYANARLASFVSHILYHHQPGTLLIICNDKGSFVGELLDSINNAQAITQNDATRVLSQEHPETAHESHSSMHSLLTNTLHLLAQSREVKLVFCSSIQNLRAFLAALGIAEARMDENSYQPSTEAKPVLALVNLVALHAQSSSYSAQGISETLAAAIEATVRVRKQLVIVETGDRQSVVRDSENVGVSGHNSGQQVEEEAMTGQSAFSGDPLDVEIPVLNTTTKMFGMGGDRSVLEKTVKVGEVFKRWCHIEQLPRQ